MTMSTDSTTPGSEPPTPELEKRIKSERPLFFASFLMPLIAIGSMLALLGYYLYHGHPEMAIILTITATLLSLLIGLLARQVWRVQQRERKSAENLKRAQAVAHVGSWDFDLLHNA